MIKIEISSDLQNSVLIKCTKNKSTKKSRKKEIVFHLIHFNSTNIKQKC